MVYLSFYHAVGTYDTKKECEAAFVSGNWGEATDDWYCQPKPVWEELP
jgi:hypothetical protein